MKKKSISKAYHQASLLCKHRQIRRDGKIVSAFTEHDNDHVICKHCGRIFTKEFAHIYSLHVEDLK